MSVVNINGSVVRQSAYQQARASVANMQGGNLNAGGVLASIQQLNANVNVSNNTSAFSGNTGMHLGIHPAFLRRAGNDPEEMVRLKALAIDHMNGMVDTVQRFANRGIEITAVGSVIHEDGTSSGWMMGRKNPTREIRTQFELPESDRPSWVEIMQESIERAMADESSGWRI